MLDVINWLALAIAIVTAVLVPIIIVGLSLFLLIHGEQRTFTAIRALVSLLVWVPSAYVVIYVFLAVALHGGALTTPGPVGRTLQGTLMLFGASLVYVAIGYGLVVLVRGKSGSKRRLDADLKKQDQV
jgi:hypothetical protein